MEAYSDNATCGATRQTLMATKRLQSFARCVLIRAMAFFEDLITLDQIGADTLRDLERRAAISAPALLDAIRRDRVRFPPSDSSMKSHSHVCNDPTLEATGALKQIEETKAYKMLVFLAEYRDGPDESPFSQRHAYNKAGIHRQTLIGWRGDHKFFDALVSSIQEEMVDSMRAEAYRRSVVGVEEPVFYQGVRTDKVVKYSDGLLQFTLMGYDAKFRAKDVNMNVSGTLDSTINIEGLRDRLAQRLQQKSKAEE